MDRLKEILNNAATLDADELMREIYQDKELQEFILDLNRNRQLFQQGVDSTGTSLESIGGPYTTATIEGTSQFEGKRSKGLPTDHITLFDEGDFYRTFKLVVMKTAIEITADPIKDGVSLFIRWGDDVLGLNQDSRDILSAIVQNRIIPLIRASILA